jgi:hypothetical protein
VIPTFRPYERTILDALIDKFDSEARSLLSQQIQKVNYVQRHADDKEVNLFSLKWGKPFFNKDIKFPMDREEVKVAEVYFYTSANSKSMRATIWFVRGYIFSIEFDQTPKIMKKDKVQVDKIIVFVNPMIESEKDKKKIITIDGVERTIGNWLKKWKSPRVYKPLTNKLRNELVDHFNGKLPDDYIDIIAQTDGVETKEFTIYGLKEIRSLIMPDQNYYILATMALKGVLCVEQGSERNEIYYLSYERDGVPTNQGLSLCKAVERVVTV